MFLFVVKRHKITIYEAQTGILIYISETGDEEATRCSCQHLITGYDCCITDLTIADQDTVHLPVGRDYYSPCGR